METKYTIYEKKGHIAYVTMNRPEVGNALHEPADIEMFEIWQDFLNDPEMWVAILTGSGDKFFSTGHDLRSHHEHIEKGMGGASPFAAAKGGFGGLAYLNSHKPIIAAVNGYALAGGFEILLPCDIIVAAEHAQFGLPEPRVGVVSVGGGATRLIRQVPWRHAMAILLTGKRFSAQEMLNFGMINEVVPADQLMDRAEWWANEILQAAPLAVWGMKETSLMSIGMPDVPALDLRSFWVQQQMGSQDRAEGVRAFIEKRKPVWKAG